MRVKNPEQYIPYMYDGLYSGAKQPKDLNEAFLAGVELATRYFNRHYNESPVQRRNYPLLPEDLFAPYEDLM